ncbi:transporter [Shewanella sp. 3_MG-2023]|uniref:transporter n=1 Tax=Shewanella sp. 3_MG-2023 TaxID=3062635 RepID=UPI0026E15CC7|nr:transporter [Shewanella sp. 3_MG-2023]MDO6776129.1 transporter [Shewanella sp. 3_MG-2023]
MTFKGVFLLVIETRHYWRQLFYWPLSWLLLILLLIVLLLFPLSIKAQDLEPRSYTNIPIGMHFVALGYLHSEGALSPSPSVPLKDAQLTLDAAVVGYATSFAIAGRSSKLDVSASRVCMKGSANYLGEFVEADRCGYSDPNVRLTWNFYGAPAVEKKDFGQYREGLVMGTSLQLSIPVGSYDETKLINAGANQWVFRPGIGMSYKVGDWYYSAMGSVRFYSDNDEFYNQVLLSKDPQYTLQGHIIYSIARGQWLSLSGNYFVGGETDKNGIDANDSQDNSRFGLTYSLALNQQHSIKVYASTGVITRIGNDFDTFGLVWQYAFN